MLKMLNISNNYVDLYRQIICKEIYRGQEIIIQLLLKVRLKLLNCLREISVIRQLFDIISKSLCKNILSITNIQILQIHVEFVIFSHSNL